MTFKQIDTLNRLMYHTQEKRRVKLTGPVLAEWNNAWLGRAYYFWQNEMDAMHWGTESKKRTGYYEIYSGDIDCEDILDTVFNEEHYDFWIAQIEKAAKSIMKITGKKATIKEINSYFSEKAKWSEVASGIMFQDLPNSEDLLVNKFYYRKRIQLAVFKLEIILTFAFLYEQKC